MGNGDMSTAVQTPPKRFKIEAAIDRKIAEIRKEIEEEGFSPRYLALRDQLILMYDAIDGHVQVCNLLLELDQMYRKSSLRRLGGM